MNRLPSRRDSRHYSEREWSKWVACLSPQMRGRVRRKIERLLEHGTSLGMPLVRQLSGELHELRIDKYRLYFTVGGDNIWFLAYRDKDSQRRDIKRALGRI